MSFFAILFALLIEQVRPLARANPIHAGLRSWARWVAGNFDAGKAHHGWVAWGLAVPGPALAALGVHVLLVLYAGWVFAMLWSVAVLYVTLGFRQFSHHFTVIRDALLAGEEDVARQQLALWMRMDVSALPRSQIVRHVIEHSVLSAHRHVFGVFAWYSLLAALGLGPAGAVLYRIGEYFASYANRPNRPSIAPLSDALKEAASLAWYAMDWVPARITALGFAFVGSFEEAVDSWRQHEAQFPGDNDGVILAATAGAVNVKLGEPESPGTGQTPQPVHLRAVVGLVWRTVVMWMVFLALLSLARLLG